VKFEIVKLKSLSGNKASIYSVIIDNEDNTLFEQFIEEYGETYSEEILFIRDRLWQIGHNFGARDQFFKLAEGRLGDGVCVLYDLPDSNLRLYCIKYGKIALILGSGGFKPKTIRALQEDEKLKYENEIVRTISILITKAIQTGDIQWSKNNNDLIGNLILSDNENDE